MNCQEASDPSTMTPVSATHAFSLPRLPLEIQMMVLRECLTSKTPLLDYGAKPGGIQLTIVDEPGGQDDICFGILGTCKLYHEEGLKVLYAQNRFSYTESFETDERSLSRPLPAEPKSKHLSYSTQHFPYLKHLILRTMGGTTYPGSRRTIMRCQSLLAQCLHLQTLQLDFVSLPRESTKFETTILIFMNCLLSYSRMSRFIAQRPREEPRELRAENGRLRQLIITGLRADFCGLLAVIHASCLLADGGKLGVGMGGGGTRFKGKVQDEHVILESLPEPTLTWLDFQDVGRWIEANRKVYDPHGIYDKLGVASMGAWQQ